MAIFYTATVSIFAMVYLFLEGKTRPVDGQVSSTLKKTIRLATQCVALMFVALALLIALPESFAICVFLCLACVLIVAIYQLIKSKTKHLDWRPFGVLKQYIRETRNKWLHGQIATLRGIRNLAVHPALSRVFRSVRLVLYPACSLIPCFLRLATQCVALLLIAVALILGAASLPESFAPYAFSLLACIFVATYIFIKKRLQLRVVKLQKSPPRPPLTAPMEIRDQIQSG